MYQSNREEIKELNYKLAHLRENMVGNSVILDGRTGDSQTAGGCRRG